MHNATKIKAFSLMELIIVIAIVGLLTAVAMPSYKNYILSSKMGSTMPIAYQLMGKMIEYAEINGYYPNAQQLGIGQVQSDISSTVDNAEELSPYLRYIQILGGVDRCGKRISLSFIFNSTTLDQDPTDYIRLRCELWHYNGVINKKCFADARHQTGYYIYEHPSSQLIPGVPNIFENGNSQQYNNFVNGLDARSTCIGVY